MGWYALSTVRRLQLRSLLLQSRCPLLIRTTLILFTLQYCSVQLLPSFYHPAGTHRRHPLFVLATSCSYSSICILLYIVLALILTQKHQRERPNCYKTLLVSSLTLYFSKTKCVCLLLDALYLALAVSARLWIIFSPLHPQHPVLPSLTSLFCFALTYSLLLSAFITHTLFHYNALH